MVRILLLVAALALASRAPASEGVPPARGVVETFYGTEVHDPYRWLEDRRSPVVQAWMKAASDAASAALARIPGRDAMHQRIARYEAAVPARIGRIVRTTGERWFYERRGAADNQYQLVLRQGLRGRERVLVDPGAIERAGGKPHAITHFSASPGGRYVAYGISPQGSEAAVSHVIETASGRSLGAPISRTDLGRVSWTPDASRFLFSRLQELKPGMPETEKYRSSMVWLLERGAPLGEARAVFGHGVAGADVGRDEIPVAAFTHDGRWVIGIAYNGTQREIGVHVARAAGVLAGAPRWTRIVDARDEVTAAAYMDDGLYLVSHRDAPRSKVLRVELERPDLATARVLVPESRRIVTGIAAAADALYIETRDGNVKRLHRRAHRRDPRVAEVALPVEGSFELSGWGTSAADARQPGLVLDLQGWHRAPQIYLVRPDGSVRNSGLQPKGPYDAPPGIVATEAIVPSHDGALVPLSIIHKRKTRLDGRNPTLLYGYASYGTTEEPFYSASRLAWLDAGGVFAVANPRGSGVYGNDWYKAGFQSTKPNAWKDFIACAEWLIANQWTAPDRLGIWGGSAGAILVGRAMTERPDLFAALVAEVGVLDLVRSELEPNGVPNIPEFGTRTNEAGFRALLAMSTYHHIADGTRYPAVMLVHGANDPRVDVWQSAKTAARLAAVQSALPGGGRPVLLRLDDDAGHGVGSTKQQVLQERADTFAFMLWQMGVAGFQPSR